jgi:hypothetical protein
MFYVFMVRFVLEFQSQFLLATLRFFVHHFFKSIPNRPKLDDLVQDWTILSEIGRSCPRLDDPVRDWTILSKIGRSCPRLDNFVQDWTISSQIGRSCPKCHKFSQMSQISSHKNAGITFFINFIYS